MVLYLTQVMSKGKGIDFRNFYHSQGNFSRRQIDDIFLIYHSSCKLSPSETVCMILSISYVWKKLEIYFIMLSAENFIQSDKC